MDCMTPIMSLCIQVTILLISAPTLSLAQYQTYFPYYSNSQESAVSLNNAPVGLYGRKSGLYGNSEEYGVSLSGAPVGIYEKRNSWVPRYPTFYEPLQFNYFPIYYPIDYFAYDNFYNGFMNPPQFEPDSYPSQFQDVVESRRFRGSISSASSSADSQRGKTNADATAVQGTITDDIVKEILKF